MLPRGEMRLSNDDATSSEMHHFNVLFIKRFFRLCRVMFPRWKSVSVLLFIALLCVGLLEQFVIYHVGLIASKYYKVLGEKDKEGFRRETIMAMILIVSISFIKSTGQYLTRVLYVTWRKLVDLFLHKMYFNKISYYHLNVMDTTIDNPDQRITQDVDKMCHQLSTIIARLLITPFTTAYYLYLCWSTSGYLGPVCVFGFFIISSVINKFLMSPVVNYVYKQERMEGDFRFKHMQIRSNAESVAFLRAGDVEKLKADTKLGRLISTQHRLYMREYALNFSMNAASYLGSILSYIIVAIPILSGVYNDLSGTDLSALISRTSFVIMYLINCFTNLINMAGTVTSIAGTTHRIGQMIEKLTTEDEVPEKIVTGTNGFINPGWNSSNTSVETVTTVYKVDNVTYTAPERADALVKDLSLQIVTGVNVLVTGDSGCGKSSLMRVLDGLWDSVTGQVHRYIPRGSRGVMYLPQKPFFSDGTLWEQIIYPLTPADTQSSCVAETEVIQFLCDVGLANLLDRVGGLDMPVCWNWCDVLSPGEMQRLSFVRLFFHQPPVAMLDEATSQVDLSVEKKLYEICQRLNITIISVGHRPTLHEFHDMELHLDGLGGWTLTPIHQLPDGTS